MAARIRHHIRNNVIGYLALFVALSGTAYAVDGPLAGQNTVGSADIINGEVTTDDLAANSVGSGKIINGNVQNNDLSTGASSSNTIADGGVQGIDVRNGTLDGNHVANDSLTGTDVADTNSLGSPEIGELGSVDIAFNSLTGNDIAESSLGTVPQATKAFQMRPMYVAAENGSGVGGGGSVTGGLGWSYNCAVATGDLTVEVSTNTDNSTLAVSDDDSYADIEDFDVADGNVDLEKLVGADSDEVINLVYVEGSGFGLGHKVITGQLHLLDDAPAGDQSECLIAGHLIFGTE